MLLWSSFCGLTRQRRSTRGIKFFREARQLSTWYEALYLQLLSYKLIVVGICTRLLVAGTQGITNARMNTELSACKVAVDRTSPSGRVIGIDVIPAQPPKGVSTIQGNFLSQTVQDEVKRFLREPDRGRTRHQPSLSSTADDEHVTEEDLVESSMSYVELEKRTGRPLSVHEDLKMRSEKMRQKAKDETNGRMVDVVLSDMLAPWDQTEGFWKRSKSNPYYRMMNTSGINTRDHAGSMVRAIVLNYRLAPAY